MTEKKNFHFHRLCSLRGDTGAELFLPSTCAINSNSTAFRQSNCVVRKFDYIASEYCWFGEAKKKKKITQREVNIEHFHVQTYAPMSTVANNLNMLYFSRAHNFYCYWMIQKWEFLSIHWSVIRAQLLYILFVILAWQHRTSSMFDQSNSHNRNHWNSMRINVWHIHWARIEPKTFGCSSDVC